MYENQMQGQMAKQTLDPTTEALNFFKDYVSAKNEFDDACRNVQASTERREIAAKRLAEINQRVIDIANRALSDPTAPSPNAPTSGSTGMNYGIR